MGLIFALEADLKHSTSEKLVLKSNRKRWALGGTLLITGLILTTMYLAAAPLFKMLWLEGTLFDQGLTFFILSIIYGFPILALLCWFYQEVVEIEKVSSEYKIQRYIHFPGFSIGKKETTTNAPLCLEIKNQKDVVNVASLQSPQNRYSTQGHWLLSIGKAPTSLVIEARAKKPEIESLDAFIKKYFQCE